jgi:hypothetical protein
MSTTQERQEKANREYNQALRIVARAKELLKLDKEARQSKLSDADIKAIAKAFEARAQELRPHIS